MVFLSAIQLIGTVRLIGGMAMCELGLASLVWKVSPQPLIVVSDVISVTII